MAMSKRKTDSPTDVAPALQEGMLPDFITGQPVKETPKECRFDPRGDWPLSDGTACTPDAKSESYPRRGSEESLNGKTLTRPRRVRSLQIDDDFPAIIEAYWEFRRKNREPGLA